MSASQFVTECLQPVLGLFLGMVGNIINLYTTQIVLTAVLALWVFRKIVDIFELIKP